MSKPSPVTGAVTTKRDSETAASDAKPDGKADVASKGKPARGGDGVEIALQHARSHHLRWLVLGLGLGALCVTKLGTLGQGVGIILLALGAWAGFRVVQTLRHPPGTIIVDGDHVVLPRGLCQGDPIETTRGAVTASYLLRKAVAWHQAAPVLVVETGDRVLAYPRDWFAGEADQRRILDALLAGSAAEPAA